MPQFTREDVVSKIHKTIRKILFDLSYQASHTDFSNLDEIAPLAESFRFMEHLLLHHADAEEKFVFPLLEERKPGVTTEDLEDHHRIHADIHALGKRLTDLAAGITPAGEESYQWYLDLNTFIAEYMIHMSHEENVTARLIKEVFSFEELMQAEGAIVASFTPPELMATLRVMVPAMYHAERVKFLSGIQRGAPAPVFEMIMATVSEVLESTSLARLKSALTPAVANV